MNFTVILFFLLIIIIVYYFKKYLTHYFGFSKKEKKNIKHEEPQNIIFQNPYFEKFQENNQEIKNNKDNIAPQISSIQVTLYYSNSCSHCIPVKGYFKNLVTNGCGIDYIIFRMIENNELINMPEIYDLIQGFPTIMIKHNNKIYPYQGSRDENSLIEYLKNL